MSYSQSRIVSIYLCDDFIGSQLHFRANLGEHEVEAEINSVTAEDEVNANIVGRICPAVRLEDIVIYQLKADRAYNILVRIVDSP